MTPIVKAYFTDQGSACANLGVQVMGGHGYIRECGMEQLVRDARITQLYEGTNGIQALDLVGRKLPAHFGRYLRSFFHPVMAFIEQHQADPALAEFVLPLAKAFARLQQITLHVAQQGLKNPDEAGAASSRLSAPVRPGRDGLSSGRAWPRSPRPGSPAARPTSRRSTGQDRHRALLHDQAAAGERRAVRPDHGRQRAADGVRGRGVLIMRRRTADAASHGTAPWPRPCWRSPP